MPMQEILTVSQLTSAIKKQLESRFTALSVRGEISNLKEQASGHLYFTLKDQDSQISAVLFRGNTRGLTRMPKGGDQVVVRGEISVYAPRGNYQLIVRELDYLGVGELLLKLHELKNKLEKRGWFSPEIKKKLPKYPKTIGVVTSATGSVIQDILNILNRRFSGFHLVLNPVKVQGEGAAQEIAKAIDQFNQHCLADVLIVGRGGGSLEDLWAFNEEVVADAIFRSQIPIISAVGHETDTSIADYVADVRAPTPSAAAEMAIAEKAQQLQFLKQSHARMTYAVKALASQHRKILERFQKSPHMRSAYTLLGTHLQRIDDFRNTLDLGMRQQLQKKQLQLQSLAKQSEALKPITQVHSLKQRLASMEKAVCTAICQQIASAKRHFDPVASREVLLKRCQFHLQEKKQRLQQLVSHLQAIDPKNLLTKGYCILFQEKLDSVILSSQELSVNTAVRILMHDGTVKAHIEEITP
ncbi:MAG: exodeoxyribonuclease VII large subunit [Parachlamydiales bacterium]|nr:exodeoxyribonuclease VII large subunit [Candidatus Acheromyda pituitae]